jgi:hypothetical protein
VSTYPITEILDDGWDTAPAKDNTATDVAKRIMRFPMGNTTMSRNLRANLLARAKWLGAIPAGVDNNVLCSVECAFVTQGLNSGGFDVRAGYARYTTSAHQFSGVSRRAQVLALIGTYGTYVHDLLINQEIELDFEEQFVVDEFARLLPAVKEYDDVVALTKVIEALLLDKVEPPTKQEVKEFNAQVMSFKPLMGAGDELSPEELDDAKKSKKKGGKLLLGTSAMNSEDFELPPGFHAVMKKFFARLEDQEGSNNEWGRLKLETPVLTERILKQRVASKKVSSQEGAYIHDISRVFTDEKIFRRNTKTLGGAVLIDVSGSMCLTPEQIVELVKAAPAVAVATYAGDTNSTGVCRVIAHNGFSVKDYEMTPDGGRNVIDGPALHEWLAKQPMPRIWVSDGLVTGLNDNSAPNLTKDAAITIAKHSIVRVDGVAEAIEMFKEVKKNNSTLHPTMAKRAVRELYAT